MQCDEFGPISYSLYCVVGVLDTCEQLQAWGLDRLMCVYSCDVMMCKSSACIS